MYKPFALRSYPCTCIFLLISCCWTCTCAYPCTSHSARLCIHTPAPVSCCASLVVGLISILAPPLKPPCTCTRAVSCYSCTSLCPRTCICTPVPVHFCFQSLDPHPYLPMHEPCCATYPYLHKSHHWTHTFPCRCTSVESCHRPLHSTHDSLRPYSALNFPSRNPVLFTLLSYPPYHPANLL